MPWGLPMNSTPDWRDQNMLAQRAGQGAWWQRAGLPTNPYAMPGEVGWGWRPETPDQRQVPQQPFAQPVDDGSRRLFGGFGGQGTGWQGVGNKTPFGMPGEAGFGYPPMSAPAAPATGNPALASPGGGWRGIQNTGTFYRGSNPWRQPLIRTMLG